MRTEVAFPFEAQHSRTWAARVLGHNRPKTEPAASSNSQPVKTNTMTTNNDSASRTRRHPPPPRTAAHCTPRPVYVAVLRGCLRELALEYLADDDLRDSAVAVLRLLRQRQAVTAGGGIA